MEKQTIAILKLLKPVTILKPFTFTFFTVIQIVTVFLKKNMKKFFSLVSIFILRKSPTNCLGNFLFFGQSCVVGKRQCSISIPYFYTPFQGVQNQNIRGTWADAFQAIQMRLYMAFQRHPSKDQQYAVMFCINTIFKKSTKQNQFPRIIIVKIIDTNTPIKRSSQFFDIQKKCSMKIYTNSRVFIKFRIKTTEQQDILGELFGNILHENSFGYSLLSREKLEFFKGIWSRPHSL